MHPPGDESPGYDSGKPSEEGWRFWTAHLGRAISSFHVHRTVGPPARFAEPVAVLHGEYWRLLTCHFVHYSAQHLLLNAVGLGLVAALFPREYSLAGWLSILAGSIAAIDLGFVLLEPQLEWYVGLSGVLHGALAARVAARRGAGRPGALAAGTAEGRRAVGCGCQQLRARRDLAAQAESWK